MRLRKASLLTISVLLVLILFAAVTITTLRPKIEALRLEKQTLTAEVDELKWENENLEESITMLGTDKAVKAIARQRLHLVADGETIYIDNSK